MGGHLDRAHSHVLLLVDKHDPTALVLTETDWHQDYQIPCIRGYEAFTHTASSNKRMVRCIIYVKESKNPKILKEAMTTGVPLVTIVTDDLLLQGSYRQFHGQEVSEEHDFQAFCDALEVATHVRKRRTHVVMGDMNLDMAKLEYSNYKYRTMLQRLIQATTTAGLTYLPTAHTWRSRGEYKDGHRYSTIDHIYTSKPTKSEATLLDDAPDDHAPLALCSYAPTRKEKKKVEKCVQDFKHADYPTMDMLFSLTKWPSPESPLSDHFDMMMTALSVATDMTVPLKNITFHEDRPNISLSAQTKQAQKDRNTALKTGSPDYRRLRNIANRLIKGDRIKSAVSRLKQGACPWSIVRDLTGNTSRTLPMLREAREDAEAAEICNSFYVNKPQLLRAAIPPMDLSGEFSTNNQHTEPPPVFELMPVDVETIRRHIQKLNNTRARGTDGIPIQVFKECMNSLAEPVSNLVNASIRDGVYPSQWRESLIHPILKPTKDKEEPASYRPVAILCALSKVMESVVHEQLSKHLELHGLLPNQQHGFRQGRSTTTALAEIMDFVSVGSGPSLVTAFDFSSAFDTLQASTVIEALKAVGTADNALKWFSSYMLPGIQRVCWNEAVSDPQMITYGVRQGSILGPLLFILVTRMLPTMMESAARQAGGALNSVHVLVILYADDTTLLVRAKSTEVAQGASNAAIACLVSQAAKLGLTLNTTKTQLMALRSDNCSVRVRYDHIPPQANIRLLGFTLDKRGTLLPYVEDTIAAINRVAGVIRSLRYAVPVSVLRLLAQALAGGRARVGASAYLHARINNEDIVTPSDKRVQVAMNNVARAVLGKQRGDRVSVKELRRRSGLPSVNEMAVSAAASSAWDAMAGHGVLRSQLQLFESANTRAATAGLLQNKRSSTTFQDNVIRVWNAFAGIREAESKMAMRAVVRRRVINNVPT